MTSMIRLTMVKVKFNSSARSSFRNRAVDTCSVALNTTVDSSSGKSTKRKYWPKWKKKMRNKRSKFGRINLMSCQKHWASQAKTRSFSVGTSHRRWEAITQTTLYSRNIQTHSNITKLVAGACMAQSFPLILGSSNSVTSTFVGLLLRTSMVMNWITGEVSNTSKLRVPPETRQC